METICLHQLCRPPLFQQSSNGRGNCSICEIDKDNNRHCAAYRPIGAIIVFIDDKEEKDDDK